MGIDYIYKYLHSASLSACKGYSTAFFNHHTASNTTDASKFLIVLKLHIFIVKQYVQQCVPQ